MILLSLIAAGLIQTNTVAATREQLVDGIAQLNSDVIELRNEIESSISNRCESILGCYKSSYDECRSEYTSSQECPSLMKLGYAIPGCGAGEKCNGLFDYSITTVRLPASVASGPNGNPKSPEVIEAICYTRTAEKWMVDKHNKNQELDLWKKVSSPEMFFGSSTGAFRIFPARQSKECGRYDPRTRPWYEATLPSTISNSVKPRRVVIVMDTSLSMNETINQRTGETKLSFIKKAVTSTVASLSDRASISVIRFGEFPSLVGRPGSSPPFLWQKANGANKKRIIDGINDMKPKGRSNWSAGFNFAFNLIENSLNHITAKDQAGCKLENIALLFFSDGEYNLPAKVTDEEIVELVSSNVEQVEAMGDYHVNTFLYSIGNSAQNQVTKKISCAVDGYWTAVTSFTNPGNVTNGYRAFYSIPMGTDDFYNYTSWSDPYTFSTSGELGFTVSSLVYNRDVEPPRFMGAVGMDIGAEAAKVLYGGSMDETLVVMDEILNNRNLENFNASCEDQRITLSYCETQSMRQLAGGSRSICLPPKANFTSEELKDLLYNSNRDIILNLTDQYTATNITGGESPTESELEQAILGKLLNCSKGFLEPCAGYDEYPHDMWKNTATTGETFLDRVCCEVNTTTVSNKCPKLDVVRNTRISDAWIFGIMFTSLAVAELICCFYCFYVKKRRNALRD